MNGVDDTIASLQTQVAQQAKPLSDTERRNKIRTLILECQQNMNRMSAIVVELERLGCDAAFKYNQTDDGYGGELEFVHFVRDKPH